MLTGLRSLINSTRYCVIPTASEKTDTQILKLNDRKVPEGDTWN